MLDSEKPYRSMAEIAQVYYDLQDAREARKYVPTEKFAKKVADVMEDFDARSFRKLCFTAVALGLTSSQDIVKNCGDVIPRNLKKLQTEWSLPNPTKVREVLGYFSTLDPNAAKTAPGSTASSDNKLPWRHSQCAPPEAAPALPG